MHVCVPLWKGATAENVAKAYRKGWTRWAGVPLKLFSDGGTEFDKEFQNALDVQGTYAEKAAAEAPWQNGLCERNQQTWKSIFEKAFEECVPTNKQEVNQLIDQVNNSKNGVMKRHGYAPCQHVFGCSPRLPDSILNGDACVVSNSAYLHGDHDVVRAQAIRLAARRALVEADNEDKVRRAIEHRTRKERGPFSVGDLVYYYRKLVGAKGVWKGPGRIIGMLENRSRIWVCHGNKVLRCCPEQLRGLSEDQEAAFRLVPMEILRRRHEQPSPGAQTFSDISGEGVPPDDWEPPPVDRSKRPRVSFEDAGVEEERPPDGAAETEADGNESTVLGSGSVHTASQPASRRPSVQEGGYGPAPRSSQGRERRQEMMSTARPSSSTAGPTDEQIQYAMDKDLTLDEMRKMSEASYVPVPEDDEGLQVELKMTKDAMEVNLLQLLEEHAKCIETELEAIHQSDVFMAQQLRNAEVRERDLSATEVEELLAAKAKEWQKLLGTGAIKVFSGPEVEILRKQIDPGRILKSRFVKTRRPHPKQPGKMELKCRWCVKGYLDPDAESLQRQAPTLSGDGLAMVLQMIASRGWLLEIADVEGAFLQGEPLKREAGPIYVEMPREEVPGAAPGSLVQLIKCVYGLMDAPRQWYDSFMATMEGLGMRRSKLDPCVLMWFDGEELGGICAVHVDDMVIAGNQKFHETVLSKLKEAYPFKHWRIGKGDFLGRYLEQKEDKTIVCSQKEYADKVEVLNISRERRRQKDQPLTTSEMRQLRGVVGAASWLVGSTRPDIAAQTAILQQRLGSPTVQELIDANKLVARIKDLSKVRITFQPIPISQVMFLAASDASWSNNDDLKTQAGYMTMAVDREIQNEVWAKMTPLRWKSYKLERRTQSTLGAELMAIARAVAEANWMRSLWAEASNRDYTLQNDLKFRNRTPLMVATDNKPIYDHSQADGIVVKDKRVAIDMLLLKSDLSDSNVILRWLDTKQMVVDGMTKSNASIDYLLYVLKQGEFIVVRVAMVESFTVLLFRSIFLFLRPLGCYALASRVPLLSILNLMRSGTEQFGDVAPTLVARAKQSAGSLLDGLDTATSEVRELLNGVFGSFQKHDLGKVCTPTDVGFWYYVPTDCGFFDKFGNIFSSPSAADSNWGGAVDRLRECTMKTGAFNFPTPFLDFRVQEFCLPTEVQTPVEYILGIFKFGANGATSLVSHFETIAAKVQGLVSSSGLDLMQIGQQMKLRRNAQRQLALAQTGGNASSGVWHRCACEQAYHSTNPTCMLGSTCQCNGQVRYGYGNQWYTRTASGSIQCSNSVFGDPFRSQGKECQCFAPKVEQGSWERCACARVAHPTFPSCTSSSTCNCNGQVRFGYGDKWSTSMATGDIHCGTSVLGDPDPGQAKECQCFKPSVIPKSTWGLQVSTCFDWTFVAFSFSLCVGLLFGEKDGAVVLPNLVMDIEFGATSFYESALEKKEPEAGFSLDFDFKEEQRTDELGRISSTLNGTMALVDQLQEDGRSYRQVSGRISWFIRQCQGQSLDGILQLARPQLVPARAAGLLQDVQLLQGLCDEAIPPNDHTWIYSDQVGNSNSPARHRVEQRTQLLLQQTLAPRLHTQEPTTFIQRAITTAGGNLYRDFIFLVWPLFTNQDRLEFQTWYYNHDGAGVPPDVPEHVPSSSSGIRREL
ncbi:Copia protein [Symbiodinium microadriaticum]|uniref:Copia protein n=1 Tax=Symbiodinium microadriaticum TaxID=2951 RepID=A0A1Q9EQ09_SYMMI|nr:Copia protein [Symbiodinium microadriaticum]